MMGWPIIKQIVKGIVKIIVKIVTLQKIEIDIQTHEY